MPDSLILESPAHPSVSSAKRRCAKARKSKPTIQEVLAAAAPTSSISAVAAATAADALHSAIFHEADEIEIGSRRAKTSLDLVWSVLDDVSDIGGKLKDAGDDHLESLTAQLYLLLRIVGDELTAANTCAHKLCDAARELKRAAPTQPFGTGDNLLALRLQLKAAEDALNATDDDDDEPPLADAYDEANDRFIEAPTRTPSDVLLKLERLADLSEMQNDPDISTNRIVLNLIRDLRGALGVNGQVQ